MAFSRSLSQRGGDSCTHPWTSSTEMKVAILSPGSSDLGRASLSQCQALVRRLCQVLVMCAEIILELKRITDCVTSDERYQYKGEGGD